MPKLASSNQSKIVIFFASLLIIFEASSLRSASFQQPTGWSAFFRHPSIRARASARVPTAHSEQPRAFNVMHLTDKKCDLANIPLFFPRVFSIVTCSGSRADDIFPILFPFTSLGEIPLFSGKNGIN